MLRGREKKREFNQNAISKENYGYCVEELIDEYW
jgi:hypothetical protein